MKLCDFQGQIPGYNYWKHERKHHPEEFEVEVCGIHSVYNHVPFVFFFEKIFIDWHAQKDPIALLKVQLTLYFIVSRDRLYFLGRGTKSNKRCRYKNTETNNKNIE